MLNEKEYDYKITAAGRINIIGEHIDYCGGKVMPAALSLKNTIYIRPNGTNKINLSWTTLPIKVSLDIDKLEDYKDLKFGKEWKFSNKLPMQLTAVGDGWYKGTLDVYDFDFGTPKNDGILRIRFTFSGISKSSKKA